MKIEPENTEQQICVACGFCCDGTLFHKATALEGKSHPLIEIETAEDGNRGFILPCHLFKDGCCSIYDQERPSVCGKFRCKLLRNVAAGNVTTTEAVKRVDQAKKLKQEIFDELQALGYDVHIGLNQAVAQFKTRQLETLSETEFNTRFAKLLVKYQLLNEYLKKHFKRNRKKKQSNVDE